MSRIPSLLNVGQPEGWTQVEYNGFPGESERRFVIRNQADVRRLGNFLRRTRDFVIEVCIPSSIAETKGFCWTKKGTKLRQAIFDLRNQIKTGHWSYFTWFDGGLGERIAGHWYKIEGRQRPVEED